MPNQRTFTDITPGTQIEIGGKIFDAIDQDERTGRVTWVTSCEAQISKQCNASFRFKTGSEAVARNFMRRCPACRSKAARSRNGKRGANARWGRRAAATE